MDESSRNIVKFIGAGTGAILLLMAAYFYGNTPDPKPMPSPPKEVVKPAEPVAEAEIAVPEEPEEETYSDEDVKPIDGAPADLQQAGE